MSDIITFDCFKLLAQGETPKHLRRGQYLVNLLTRVRPDLGRQMTADKDYDPFYRDDRIPAFWEWVKQNWEVQP